MNKKHIIIGGIIVVILGFFGTKSYLSIEKDQEKYRNSKNQAEKKTNSSKLNDLNTEGKNYEFESDNSTSENQSKFAGQTVFTYSSDNYDIEMPNGSVTTKHELTYHTFDFNKKTVTQISVLNGERINVTYPFYGMYEEKGLIATTYVLKVGTLGLKEIWWSPDVPNLGYDYNDGKRIACYDLKIKTK